MKNIPDWVYDNKPRIYSPDEQEWIRKQMRQRGKMQDFEALLQIQFRRGGQSLRAMWRQAFIQALAIKTGEAWG